MSTCLSVPLHLRFSNTIILIMSRSVVIISVETAYDITLFLMGVFAVVDIWDTFLCIGAVVKHNCIYENLYVRGGK